MTPVQQSKSQRDLEAPWLGMCATASSVIICADVTTHLRRAISELVAPATVLSGTHWRQRLARLINCSNDALPLFQKYFCLLLCCATKNARGNQRGFPWNRAVCSALFHTHNLFNLLLWEKNFPGIYPSSPYLSKLVRTSSKLNKPGIRF